MDIIDELNTFFPDLNNFQYVYDGIFDDLFYTTSESIVNFARPS